jgi:hypothetical protein
MKFFNPFRKSLAPIEEVSPILALLKDGKIHEAKSLISSLQKLNFPITKSILHDLIEKDTVANSYPEKFSFRFDYDYTKDLKQTLDIFSFSSEYSPWKRHRNALGYLLVDILISYSDYIKQNGNSEGSISGNHWMNGAVLRAFISSLVPHFIDIQDDSTEYTLLHAHCGVTMAIMGHYEYEVGPSMLALARWFEKHHQFENASSYYEAIIKDFARLTDGLEEMNPNELPEEIYISLQCFNEACECFKRLNPSLTFTYEQALLKSRETLTRRPRH